MRRVSVGLEAVHEHYTNAPLVRSLAGSTIPSPRGHRTGRNIPVKDYRAEKIEAASPDIINPSNRPMANVLGRKPGQQDQITAPAPPSIGTIAPVT
jgi:hypothetical protein